MSIRISIILICLWTSIFFGACGTLKVPYYSDEANNWHSENLTPLNEEIHSLYLIGNGGGVDDTTNHKNYVLDAASNLIKKDNQKTSLVFLGDNSYSSTLSKKDQLSNDAIEQILKTQIELSQSHQGKTYFIPGNHDWRKGKKGLKKQEDFIKSFSEDKDIKFYPKNACADPEVVKINKDLVFVFLDTQWWLQDWHKEKKMNHKCDIKSRADFLKRFEEIIIDHKNDDIVVMLHHSIQSNGKHGGKFSLKHHIFPLTEINSKLWIPLPIIGSCYPIFRNVTGSKQDITNASNTELMQGLNAIAKKWSGHVIFASGNDHGLQYFDNDKIKYIVSGGGRKTDYLQRGYDALYARDARGFAKITFHQNNESWLEMYTVSGFNQPAVLEFKTQLRAPRKGTVPEEKHYPPITNESITIAASNDFKAGPFKKCFLGEQYREIWSTPVEAEIINLETKLGGLKPIKKGGGMASNSLRMERENGQQYILRSIKKDYTKLVPSGFENLKLINIIADQNSASHPYNALAIPTLSKATGIFYTHPKLVYLKHQKGLGNYNSQFPEELYLLEERPSDDWSNAAQFGYSSEIIGYANLLDDIVTKKNIFIDQEWVLKSRIFDLYIHDWDRHDDQWRWAKFEEDGKNVYRPIPRDRDQAFYKFKGIIPWYIATFVMKKFKTMKEDVKDVKNLSFNAKHFDRHFLNELEWSDWEPILKQMQSDITDQDIENAMRQFPKEIANLDDTNNLEKLLKERRSNLLQIGKKLYDFLSREVEIVGTDNKDNFEITQHENGNLTVIHYVQRKNKKELLKYERTFYPNETKEVRIYGLRDKDDFKISGANNNAIRLRIIGGEDNDDILNQTDARKIYAYDNPEGIEFKGNVIDKTAMDIDVNEYDRNAFKYNTNFPIITFGNTVDDGFWFGGSINWTTHGWRKHPYKTKQSFEFSVAPGSQDAYQIGYKGDFTNTFGPFNFAPSVDINFPEYENYFGLGSNSSNPLTFTEYNWVRMKNMDVNPHLRYKIGKTSQIDFGPTFRYRNVENSTNRITDDNPQVFSEDALEVRTYLGGSIKYNLKFVEGGAFPTNGFAFATVVSHMIEPSKKEQITELSFETQAYIQLMTNPKVVLANNFGFMVSYGDRQFYQYPALGNNRGLRGYRNERFRGNSILYNNLDLRIKLINWDNNVLPMDVGILGGYDVGKIYFDDGQQNDWKSSQTIGLWFDILGALVLQPYYSINTEQNTFTLKVGFNF